MGKKYATVISAAITLWISGGLTPAHAAPNLWWDHLESMDMSQSVCVNKANTFLTGENMEKVTKDVDSVRAWTKETIAVVECLKPGGDKTTIMVLVGSDDAEAGSKLFNKLKEKMQK